MEKTIVIPGKPIAKARPRFCVINGISRAYSAQGKQERITQKEIRFQWREKPLDCPIILNMVFCMPITKASKKAVEEMLDGTTKHAKKPDLSNLIKYYEDVMNGIVYLDDSQVYEVEATKAYAQRPETIITVRW